MKWFVIFAIILGAYFWMLVTSTNMVMDQTMQLHRQYQVVAEQSEQIAAGNR